MEKETICPLRLVNDIIGGKWKQSIICILEKGTPVRYGEIKRKIPDITNMMLAQSLKSLESYGIVNRIQYDEMPVRVEYTLTEEGISLLQILGSISKWGKEYISKNNQYESQCDTCHLIHEDK